ncbi:LysR family transcriptional regulator [Microbacterium terregens]|uniref:LysR family transcriptional regulator n=1 Tax=Microbacterium terregens TaxID=69363 RepID=A0ABV5T233_9MICO
MPQDPLLSRLDLNLLVSLDALLRERNVTRAAERLHLSQPSLSTALSRLRIHFDDDLLARRGNAYELTPLATRLLEHTTLALSTVRRVFESQARWNASESTREFTIHGSDYALATIAPLVSRMASAEAPDVRFRFVPTSSPAIDDVMARLASLDGVLLPHGIVKDRPSLDLWRDDWVLLAAEDNPLGDTVPTLANLSALPWVFTYQTRAAFTAVGRQLEQLGLRPRVEVVAESFALLHLFVEHTERLALIQRKLVPLITRMGGLRVYELPFDAVPLIEALWWHPAHDNDPGHEWLREMFAAAARELD